MRTGGNWNSMIVALFVALVIPLFFVILLLQDENSRYLITFFAWGALAGLLSNFSESSLLVYVPLSELSIEYAPIIEEFFKASLLFALIFFHRERLEDKRIILYAFFSGMGFSILENFYYLSTATFFSALDEAMFIFIRSISTTIMHGLTTGFIGLGLYYVFTHKRELSELRVSFLPLVLVIQVFGFAVMFHALFNLYVQASSFGKLVALCFSVLLYLATWILVSVNFESDIRQL
jgi:RsiW-degrading membrane proteinase PrsW (M82 family)